MGEKDKSICLANTYTNMHKYICGMYRQRRVKQIGLKKASNIDGYLVEVIVKPTGCLLLLPF